MLQPKDVILKVSQGETDAESLDVMGWDIDDVVSKIRGPKGTKVTLTILKPDATEKVITITRDVVIMEEGFAKSLILSETDRQDKVGYIFLPKFYADFTPQGLTSCATDVAKEIEKLKAEKVEGIIMDLRGNGGGSLPEVVRMVGFFIEDGPVCQVRGRDDKQPYLWRDKDKGVLYDGPLTVLVDENSASASEIFAGAIQDYHRGIVVGEQTFGKGTVQSMIDLTNFLPKDVEKPGQLNLTRAKFYRITGSSTQHKGVTPDIQLPSGFDADKFGESAEPSALPWDQIKATSYNQYQDVDDKILVKIREQYTQRLKSDPELKKLAEDFVEFKKAREKTVVSLQETKRRLEREEQEKKRLALNKSTAGAASASEDGDTPDDTRTASANTPKAKLDKDVYLKECGRVLADLIALHK